VRRSHGSGRRGPPSAASCWLTSCAVPSGHVRASLHYVAALAALGATTSTSSRLAHSPGVATIPAERDHPIPPMDSSSREGHFITSGLGDAGCTGRPHVPMDRPRCDHIGRNPAESAPCGERPPREHRLRHVACDVPVPARAFIDRPTNPRSHSQIRHLHDPAARPRALRTTLFLLRANIALGSLLRRAATGCRAAQRPAVLFLCAVAGHAGSISRKVHDRDAWDS